MTSSIRVFFYSFGYVQILKMPKLLINNQTRASNEWELVSKSIITAFNFLLASKMFCRSNIYGTKGMLHQELKVKNSITFRIWSLWCANFVKLVFRDWTSSICFKIGNFQLRKLSKWQNMFLWRHMIFNCLRFPQYFDSWSMCLLVDRWWK